VNLEVKELSCTRGGRQVFSGVDIRLSPSELLVVTGPNGSGKSSLLRVLAGFLSPTEGTICWDGTSITEDREAHGARTHYVGHQNAVKSVFTVEENLAFWAGFEGAAGVESRISSALDQVGLRAQADLPAGFLSAGQRRRLNLARLVVHPTALWLLDEPTAALDDASAEIVARMIRDHCTGGGIAIAATHLDLGIEAAQGLDINDYRPRPQIRAVS
jgi:heme exporter protein A